jgi:pimeloyl-ACP methyl ester carboxylesterase
MSDEQPAPSFLQRPGGDHVAYHRSPGRLPGVVFLTGYKSDMTGQKAVRLEQVCRAAGRAFLRFDYQGHGASSGRFEDGTIGRWADDAIAVLDALTEGPQVLVGSSLGGWIMLLAARVRPQRIAGLLGVAAAPDFTEREVLQTRGVVPVYSPYDPEPTPVTRLIIEEARAHLVLRAPIRLPCPVRLIHGMRDPDVPWRTSLRLADALTSEDVEITLVKSGDHRLSQPEDLDRLVQHLERLLALLEARGGGR